jgi:hypothetical protein
LNGLKKNQEKSNIQENKLPGDSIERNIKCPNNSIGKIQETQENPHGDSTKELCSCCDATFPSPLRPSMDFQDATKGEGNQTRSRLNRSHLNS